MTVAYEPLWQLRGETKASASFENQESQRSLINRATQQALCCKNFFPIIDNRSGGGYNKLIVLGEDYRMMKHEQLKNLRNRIMILCKTETLPSMSVTGRVENMIDCFSTMEANRKELLTVVEELISTIEGTAPAGGG